MTRALEVTGLSRRFGGVTAVDDVSFVVQQGQVCGLIGPNGSGKSTTLHLVSGFIRQNSGTLELFGRNVDRLPVHNRVSIGLGRTFQSPAVFGELSVFQNLVIACHNLSVVGRRLSDVIFRPRRTGESTRRIEERCWHVLALVGLASFADRPASELSYGQKKLLDLARALAFEPKLLLLDEPAAGLGPSLARLLADIIQELRRSGTTVLFAEHNMKLIMSNCDRVIVLNFGRLIADGTPDEIRRDGEVRRAYLGQSFSS